MVQAGDEAVCFAEATLISPDEGLDLPSAQACDSKSSLKGPVIIATIPIHDDGAVPSGTAAGGISPSPHPQTSGTREDASSIRQRQRRPVWPIGAGLLIVVMLVVMVVFSVHARSPASSSASAPPTATSEEPAMESSGNGLIPEDDYLEDLDDKLIDDKMESDDWYNASATDEETDDGYYDDGEDD
jgi:hypothetical protein